MKRTVTIDGHLYTFIESLSALGTEGESVICQNESGTRFACPRELWKAYTENYKEVDIKTNVTRLNTEVA